MLLPEARHEGLTVRELPEEVLIYDLERNKAHSLNRAAALVWRHCDGRTDVAALAAILHQKLGLPPAEEIARLALEQLGRRHLLVQAPLAASPAARRSRRDMLRNLGKVAVAAAAVPVIMTLAAPKASAQASTSRVTTASDRNLKERIVPVDAQEVLDRVAALPVSTWNYKQDSPFVRHIGPMAQDFAAAFQVGEDDRHINLMDGNGVALAAIQALYRLVQERDDQLQSLRHEVMDLKEQVAECAGLV